MVAIMVVYMDVLDAGWMTSYFAEVPALLDEYGATAIAGSRHIARIEGAMPVPDRIAMFSFPSLDAIDRFMADERYRPFREARISGTRSDIFVFENAVAGRALV